MFQIPERNNYTITHIHTMLSNGVTNIDSVTDYHEYIDKAVELGMKAIAFTEHGNVFSWYFKKCYCEKKGLKYIHAIEIYVTKDLNEKVRDNYHCCLYALNYDGVKELNKLSSKAFEDDHKYYTPRISFEELLNTSNNIAISTACLGGVLNSGDEELEGEFIEFLVKNKHRCFLEIQHHNTKSQYEYNKKLYGLYKQYGIPLIASTDTHALNQEHVEGRSILQKAKDIYFDDEDGWDLTMKSYDELVEAFAYHDFISKEDVFDAINNTNVLAKMVEDFTVDTSYKYPKMYEDSLEVFKTKIKEGVIRRGIHKLPNYEEYAERIREELKSYTHNGAIDFMLLMEDIVQWCIKKDIKLGYGRGSVNGSIIAYVLGITEMDSIKYNLNFERFMNVERVSLADIDSDIPPSRVAEVREYVYNKAGLYCCDIITFNTVAMKGAIRDVCRALYKDSKPKEYIQMADYICKNVETDEERMRAEYPEVFKYVDIINGTIVSIGTHPCFTKDQMVITENGYVNIQDIKKGNMVLTHTNTFKEVVDVMSRESNELLDVKITGEKIRCTHNHPFYVRSIIKRDSHGKGRIFSKPYWKEAVELEKNDYIGIAINTNSNIPTFSYQKTSSLDHTVPTQLDFADKSLWWLIGRYIGDGWWENPRSGTYKVVICCSSVDGGKELENIKQHIPSYLKYYIDDSCKSIFKIIFHNKVLWSYLQRFGKYAYGKKLHGDVLNLPIDLLEEFLNGYLSADGHYLEKDGSWSYKTVSKELAYGIQSCIHKVYKQPCTISVLKEGKDTIEGRVVNRRRKYNCRFKKDKRPQDRNFYEDGMIWLRFVESNGVDSSDTVYNLSVLDDNSYTVNNVVVHNCGLVVSPFPIDDWFGTCKTKTCPNPVSQIYMKEIDALNFVKLDLLSLDTIEIIDKTCRLANIPMLTPDNLDVTDMNVWMSIREDTTGIFQWEGVTGDKYIKKLLSDETLKRFSEILNTPVDQLDLLTLLTIGNSAIRPAGASYREDLAQGVVKLSGSKAIDDFLSSTFGYLVFQCQIIQFLHEYCGFTMGQADIVRRGFAKKTGTEQYIPIIKNGGYMGDNPHYIKGFIQTMQEEYGQTREEAEESIVAFLQVIESASLYVFSLNHSQPYSLEGYACGWLRYYYPLEFLTTELNTNQDKQEKTEALISYINKVGIQLKNPQFRYSKGEYFFDRETNSIYKGIGSIKFFNNNIGEQLYALRGNQYARFEDLLVDIYEKTDCNSKHISILIKIGFFEEFGNINKLLRTYEIFDELYNKKQITFKKAQEVYRATEEVLLQFGNNISEKTGKAGTTYKELDWLGFVKYLVDRETFEEPTIATKIGYQLECLGFSNITDSTLPKSICYVSNLESNSYGTIFATLYCINNGKNVTIRVDKRFYNAQEKLLEKGDTISISVKKEPCKAKNPNPTGKHDIWVETGEYRTVLKSWSYIV